MATQIPGIREIPPSPDQWAVCAEWCLEEALRCYQQSFTTLGDYYTDRALRIYRAHGVIPHMTCMVLVWKE